MPALTTDQETALRRAAGDDLPSGAVAGAGFDAQGRLLGAGGVVLDVAAAQASVLRAGAYNLRPDNMRKFRRAKNGAADGLIVFIGDSVTRGQAGGTAPGTAGANPVGEYAGSYPSQAANALSALGITTRKSNFCCGTSYTIASQNLADPRLVIPNDWTTTATTLGGTAITSPNSVTSVLSFTPEEAFDTVDLYYIGSAASGSIAVAIDSGAVIDTWATANNPGGVYKRTIAGITLGQHALKISRASGGAINLCLVVCRNSTEKSLQTVNAGWAGSRTFNWVTGANPWMPVPALAVIQPALVCISLGINDIGNGVGTATFKTNMQFLISGAKAAGVDVAILQKIETSTTTQAIGLQQAYWDVERQLADENDIPIILMGQHLGTYEAANADGYFHDLLHPKAAGYKDIGRLVARALAEV